jgi:hypothetical protein
MAHFAQSFSFNLTDTLTGHFEAESDFFEGLWFSV